MTIFICRSCGYKTEKIVAPEKCPYCSKNRTMAREANAEEILNFD